MKPYTESDLQDAYNKGFSAGRHRQYREDRKLFEQETAYLRAQNEAILKHVATLDAMKPYILKTK